MICDCERLSDIPQIDCLSHDVSAEIGDPVTLKCQVKSSPSARVEWYFGTGNDTQDNSTDVDSWTVATTVCSVTISPPGIAMPPAGLCFTHVTFFILYLFILYSLTPTVKTFFFISAIISWFSLLTSPNQWSLQWLCHLGHFKKWLIDWLIDYSAWSCRLQLNIGFTLRRVLEAITSPKVNRFGCNLEHSECIVGGWPRQISGTIRTVATAGEPGEILLFCPVSNARFTVDQKFTKFEHNTSIGVVMKAFGTEFWKVSPTGSLFQKGKNFSKIFNALRLQAAITPQWLHVAGNSLQR